MIDSYETCHKCYACGGILCASEFPTTTVFLQTSEVGASLELLFSILAQDPKILYGTRTLKYMVWIFVTVIVLYNVKTMWQAHRIYIYTSVLYQ